ncbi:hypothetical protein [Mycobacterium marinum]|uniref:hypothetical protein n=1 Tax=Mycobacterium marinum TaxID=1781 RepID=UPI00235905C1|nr:hypothetical protein [Mycobacterium marinum]MDC9015130.1 hypothetical protein [Mycobacterium marinum]
MAQYPTETEVLAAVDQAGWLLEQQAARVLDQHDFKPRPSWAYPDPDEPSRSRELDVWSYRSYWQSAEAKAYIGATILIECKQSVNPYCAIGQELPEWRRRGNPTEHTLPVRYTPDYFDVEHDRLRYGYTWDVMGFRSLRLRYGQTNFRATQLTRIDRKGDGWVASNTGIFNDLVYPLAKAVRASQRDSKTRKDWNLHYRHRESKLNPPREGRKELVEFNLRFPVVLISCPLYVIDAGTDSPHFSEAKWVRVQRHLESNTLKGIFEFDVVSRSAFVEYIETVVEGFMAEFVSTVEADPLRYTGEQWIPPGVPDRSMGWSTPSEDLA